MSDLTIKKVVLTGGAADEFTGGKKERRTYKKKKENTMQGGAVPPPTAPPTASPTAPLAPLTPSLSAPMPVLVPTPRLTGAALSSVATRLLPSSTPIPPTIQPLIQSGGGGGDTKTFKIELKKKVHTKKVQLQPKKAEAPPKKVHTKKARKITLGIRSLHKRMARAKKMTRKVKEMPYDKLREHLIQKKLIKTTSKAPESVLRQIAADAQIVAGKAL